jgi:methionyl-tRNA formyltransferase
MPGPRIVFIGAERVGLACLKRLVEKRTNLVGVFTAHDDLRPKIADFEPFDDFARERGFSLIKVRSSKDPETVRQVRELRPDLIVVVSWSQIIPADILRAAPRGCVGIHYSLLPARRGGAPLNWALIDGLTESGITLFYYDEGIDTGDIVAQARFGIGPTDTVKTLLDKIMDLAPGLLAEHIDALAAGTVPRVKQDESKASYTRPRKPADSEIDWSKPLQDVYNFIRALAPPYPPAYTSVGSRRLTIPAARWDGGKLRIEGHIE